MDFNKTILSLYPPYTSVLGPYTRGDGRQHIVLNDMMKSKGEKGKTKTISYPKAIMEAYLGERLGPDDTVDHINGDFTDNRIENLQVLDRKTHARKDTLRVKTPDLICPICGTSFQMTDNQRNNGKVHFCSKRCAGIYGKRIQLGDAPIEPQEFTKEYFTLR